MITLCTLFDSNYIDKGLTMFESIERYTKDFALYVLCMDNKCYDVLLDLAKPRLIPVRLSDYETPELLKVKYERTFGEYCWTNSSCFTYFIMQKYAPDYCAYIDSDLYFYDDPNVIVSEMKQRRASVMITGHRFNWFDRKQLEWKVGKYCVEFNTFKNDENGVRLLNKWKNQCINYCKSDGDGIHWADQKYLDNWCEDYSFCLETDNLGAGVAPWNIAQYKMISMNEYGPTIIQCKGNNYRMLFYHFQGLKYINEKVADINVYTTWGVPMEMVKVLYINYLKHISRNKQMLKYNYGIDVLLRNHPGVKEVAKDSMIVRLFNSIRPRNIKGTLFHSIPRRLFRLHNFIEF